MAPLGVPNMKKDMAPLKVPYSTLFFKSVQCSEDQTSAAQGSLRQGKLQYNSSSGKIGEFKQKITKFQGKIREFDKR